MDLGINFSLLFVQAVLTLGMLALLVGALLQLRGRSFRSGGEKLLWAVIIVAAPVLGPLIFLILRPGEKS